MEEQLDAWYAELVGNYKSLGVSNHLPGPRERPLQALQYDQERGEERSTAEIKLRSIINLASSRREIHTVTTCQDKRRWASCMAVHPACIYFRAQVTDHRLFLVLIASHGGRWTTPPSNVADCAAEFGAYSIVKSNIKLASQEDAVGPLSHTVYSIVDGRATMHRRSIRQSEIG
jgi:hypothetical protein